MIQKRRDQKKRNNNHLPELPARRNKKSDGALFRNLSLGLSALGQLAIRIYTTFFGG